MTLFAISKMFSPEQCITVKWNLYSYILFKCLGFFCGLFLCFPPRDSTCSKLICFSCCYRHITSCTILQVLQTWFLCSAFTTPPHLESKLPANCCFTAASFETRKQLLVKNKFHAQLLLRFGMSSMKFCCCHAGWEISMQRRGKGIKPRASGSGFLGKRSKIEELQLRLFCSLGGPTISALEVMAFCKWAMQQQSHCSLWGEQGKASCPQKLSWCWHH